MSKVRCLDITNITVVAGTSVTLTVPTETFLNEACYNIRVCFSLKDSDATGAEVLLITSGGTTYPVLDKIGNSLQVGRLRRRELLELVYGNVSTPHFLAKNCLPCLVIKPVTVVAAVAE